MIEIVSIRENLHIQLSRTSSQICKSLIAEHRNHANRNFMDVSMEGADRSTTATEGWMNPEFVARCACEALSSVRVTCAVASCSSHGGGGALDSVLLGICASLVEAEVLPHAARWHRRDLVPALAAVWRAVLRAIVRILSSKAFYGAASHADRGACCISPHDGGDDGVVGFGSSEGDHQRILLM